MNRKLDTSSPILSRLKEISSEFLVETITSDIQSLKDSVEANKLELEKIKYQNYQILIELRRLNSNLSNQSLSSKDESILMELDSISSTDTEGPHIIKHNSPKLNNRAYNCLLRSGIRTLEDLSYLSRKQVYQLRNVGSCTAYSILTYAGDNGVFLADETSSNFENSFPDIQKSDVVESLVESTGYRCSIKKGELMTVVHVQPYSCDNSVIVNAVPQYTCVSNSSGCKLTFSVSEIRRINTRNE